MKALFNATEMGWIYDNMDQCTVSVFENKCMENLTERWLLGLSLKPKLRTYLLFKNDLSPEPYVKLCKSRRKRSTLAQFRMGVLPLEIETGRFKNIQPEERYCVLCNQGLVEDEKHFLCTCKLYASIRNELFTNVQQGNANFNNWNRDEIFCYLMSNEWKLVSNFLAWIIRTKTLYPT